MKQRTRRNIRTTLLLAAAILVLSISAFAVYQHTLGDAVLPEPAAEEGPQPAPEPGGDAAAAPSPAEEAAEGYSYTASDDRRLHMSLNGFSDSPEYQAYAEWNEWNDAWWAANPDPWTERGVDDTYFEGPANYAWYYEACFTEQVEKFGEILDKYGLTPHNAMCGFRSEAELCAALGAEDVFSFEADTLGGYMYDDGSFKAEMIWIEDGETWEYSSMTLFLAVKGSFTQISGFMPADCEEWSYTAADGTEVLLALGRYEPDSPLYGAILAELDGAYVYAGFTDVADRAELEQDADGICFALLNERFAPGADTSDIAAAVEARQAEERAANEQAEAEMYAPFADKAERDAAVFADLGHYTVTDLPEGYVFLYDSAEWKGSVFPGWEASDEMGCSTLTCGGSTWGGDDSDGVYRFLHLSYLRYFDINDLETVVNDEEFANAKEYYKAAAGEYTETTVSGYDAVIVRDEFGAPGTHYITWFDTDRGLQFTLTDDAFDSEGLVESFSDEELMAMAESVTEG